MKNIHASVISLVLLITFPSTFTASCENMVRLADLQEIIKNQTKLIRDMEQVIAVQKGMIENMAKFIQNQTILNEDVEKKIENLSTGKFIHLLVMQSFLNVANLPEKKQHVKYNTNAFQSRFSSSTLFWQKCQLGVK